MRINVRGLAMALPGIFLDVAIQVYLSIKDRFTHRRRAIELDEYERSLS